jgi:hypothetical protein
MPASFDLLVDRQDLSRRVCVPGAVDDTTPLAPGQALLQVDQFAFTSNNLTYATLGDAMDYWSFFPAAQGWGRIPVWGFGTVLRSACDAVAPGERFFGYYPVSTHLTVSPAKRSTTGFVDGAPHRARLHAAYNQYAATSADPLYDAQHEAELMLLRPLFALSFLVDDFLADNGFFGAKSVVLSSASSKTAYGMAFLLSRRRAVRVIGLTSHNNRAFVESLGCYDATVVYEDAGQLPVEPAVYVDVAGNAPLRRTVHERFGEQLRYSSSVGLTHRGTLVGTLGQSDATLPGPTPEFFFAPKQMKKRSGEWGPAGLQQRLAAAWREFLAAATRANDPWLQVLRGRGAEAVGRVMDDLLAGRSAPREGHVLTLL